MRDRLQGFLNPIRAGSRVSIPIDREILPQVIKAFTHVRTWTCGCGAELKIRSRDDHPEGKSNFIVYPTGHTLAGHSVLPPSELTWNGLATERGWIVEGAVQCPACQRGMTVDAYKAMRRERGQ